MAKVEKALAPMTFEEAAILDPDAQAGEIDAGRWVPVTRNTWRHGEVAGNVYAVLRRYAKQHPGWRVAVNDPGVKLSHNPNVLRGPDVAVLSEGRRPTGRGEQGWLDGAPELVVEVMGDAQPASDMVRKALEYLAAGALQVWVVDPDAGQVMVFDPGNVVRVLGRQETLDAGTVLPGFSCAVAELFE